MNLVKYFRAAANRHLALEHLKKDTSGSLISSYAETVVRRCSVEKMF